MSWLVPHNLWVNRPEYEAAALRVLRSGHVAQGPEVEAFEEELAERFRPGGACAVVSSCTAALLIAMNKLAIWPVSLPTYACVALLNAHIERCGDPSLDLVDCDTSFNSPHASVVVHTYGVPNTVDEDAIEDFTHAPGATLDGKPCGSMGALSVISFGATKPLGIGIGGAVLGPKDVISDIRDKRDYDSSKKVYGFNYQLGDVYAAIGRERLKRLDAENEWRLRTAQAYAHEQFERGERVWYRYVIRVKDWHKARQHFAARGIETINPLRPDELLHRRLGLPPEQFPNAEEVARTTLSLPIWPGMTDEQVSRVADALAELKE